MRFGDILLKRAFDRPARTPEELLRIARDEFRHYLRGYIDMDWMERSARTWAKQLEKAEAEVAAAGGNPKIGTDADRWPEGTR